MLLNLQLIESGMKNIDLKKTAWVDYSCSFKGSDLKQQIDIEFHLYSPLHHVLWNSAVSQLWSNTSIIKGRKQNITLFSQVVCK